MIRAWLFLSALLVTPAAHADVRLPSLLGDGMVLQQGQPLQVYGWADAGESVAVNFLGKSYQARTGTDGRWSVSLPAQQPGGPYDMLVTGKNRIHLQDVWVGEVWLCSGQSNMELDMRRLRFRYPEAVRSAGNPMIRQFLVPDRFDFKAPAADIPGASWQVASPDNVPGFSGLAYFFALEIHARTGLAVGIINAALGGSPAQSWISEPALQDFPDDYRELQRYKNDSLVQAVEQRNQRIQGDWYSQLGRLDEGSRWHWAATWRDRNGWTPVVLPSYPLTTPSGVTWYRRSFHIPAGFIQDSILLELGRLVDADSVFLNGIPIGTTGYQYPPRRYVVPGRLLREGVNEIVVRLVVTQSAGGFIPDRRYALCAGHDTISLSGQWLYKRGASMPPMEAMTIVRWKPSGLFNAMIAPLTRYAIRGVIWYQGESNTDAPGNYGALMNALVRDWRSRWGIGDFPFFGVLLAGYGLPSVVMPSTGSAALTDSGGLPGNRDRFQGEATGKADGLTAAMRLAMQTLPSESKWAELRQQQLALLQLPNTGLANAMDIGEWNDIHPENKSDLAIRLSLLARKYAYGEKELTAMGPRMSRATREGRTVRVQFDLYGSSLSTHDHRAPRYFALAGADGRFHWAEARVESDQLLLHAETVPDPRWVRYAWADYAEKLNFCNAQGLPAMPGMLAVE